MVKRKIKTRLLPRKRKKRKSKKSSDSESDGGEESKKKDKEAEPFTGQWQEASLGDQQRNDKFFRLMGGFKKSNTADEKKSASASSSFAFKALDAKRQERLYKGLEHQYDQAFQTTKMNRGKGLGFS